MRSVRRFHVQSALLASVAAVSVIASAPALAQDQIHTFNIPAQDAGKGILTFAQQAGIQVLASGATTQGRKVSEVRGRYTVQEGLRRLIGA